MFLSQYHPQVHNLYSTTSISYDVSFSWRKLIETGRPLRKPNVWLGGPGRGLHPELLSGNHHNHFRYVHQSQVLPFWCTHTRAELERCVISTEPPTRSRMII